MNLNIKNSRIKHEILALEMEAMNHGNGISWDFCGVTFNGKIIELSQL